MLHKISQFCDKIDSIKKDADRLREWKYGTEKVSTVQIDNLISQIQADCYLVSQDRSPYSKKEKNSDNEKV